MYVNAVDHISQDFVSGAFLGHFFVNFDYISYPSKTVQQNPPTKYYTYLLFPRSAMLFFPG